MLDKIISSKRALRRVSDFNSNIISPEIHENTLIAPLESEKKEEENKTNILPIKNQPIVNDNSKIYDKNHGNTIIELPKRDFLSASFHDQNSATLNTKKMESTTNMKNNKMKLEPSFGILIISPFSKVFF